MHWITILGRLFAFSKFVQYLRIFRPLKEYDSYMNSTFVLLATFLEGSQAKKKISVSSKAKLSGPFLAIQHFSQIKQVVNPTPRISLFVRPLVHPEKIPHHGYMHQGQGSWIYATFIPAKDQRSYICASWIPAYMHQGQGQKIIDISIIIRVKDHGYMHHTHMHHIYINQGQG